MEDCVTNPQLNGVGSGWEGIGAIDLAYLRDVLCLLRDMEVSEFETSAFRIRFGRVEPVVLSAPRGVSESPSPASGFETELNLARARRQEGSENIWNDPSLWGGTKPLKLDGSLRQG